MPFHEKLGLSKEDYADYNKLWDERKMVPLKDGNVVVRLEQAKPGEAHAHPHGACQARPGQDRPSRAKLMPNTKAQARPGLAGTGPAGPS